MSLRMLLIPGALTLACLAGCALRQAAASPPGTAARPPAGGEVFDLAVDRGSAVGQIQVAIADPAPRGRSVQAFPDTTRRFLLTANAVDMAAPATAEILVTPPISSATAALIVPAGTGRSLEAAAYDESGVLVARGASTSITVNAGSDTSVAIALQTLVGDISGQVKNLSANAGFADVTVSSVLATATTAADGTFTLRDLATGSLTLSYRASGSSTIVTQPVSVVAATTSVASLVGLFGTGPVVKRSQATEYLYCVYAKSATEAYAGGYGVSGNAYYSRLLRTTDGGASWATMASEVHNGGSPQFSDIRFADSSVGYAVSGDSNSSLGSLYKTTDGGATWAAVNATLRGKSVAVFDTLNLQVARYGLAIRASADGGQTIAANYTGFAQYLTGLVPVGTSNLWAASDPDYGTSATKVYKSADGGANWTNVLNLPHDSHHPLYAADVSNAIAASSNGQIYQTADGGASWTSVYAPADPVNLKAITALGTGFIAVGQGRTVIKAPGSSTWTKQVTSSTMNAVSCVADGTACWAAGFDPSTGISTIYRY